MIRILLINEQKVVREGLKLLLEAEPDLEVVGSVNNGNAALSTIEYTNLDIVIVNKRLTEINEFDLVKKIRQQYPKIKMIVLSNEVDEYHFVRVLELGVEGYIYETSPTDKIKDAIRSIYKGNKYLDDAAISTIVLPKISKSFSDVKPQKLEQNHKLEQKKYLALQEAQTIFDNRFLFKPFPDSQDLSKVTSNNDFVQDNYLELPESIEKRSIWEKRINFWLILAGLGLAATILGFFSMKYSREATIVLDNAVINGEKIAITSPTEGTLQEVNYEKGIEIKANEILAKVEKLKDNDTEELIAQLEADINLKQQQITNTNKFISVIENDLKLLQTEESPTLIGSKETENLLEPEDNSREIANLEQQIINQKVSASLLKKELSNLQKTLTRTKSQFLNNQVFNVKAPRSGKIHDLNFTTGEFVASNQQIATMVDCQNLWIEAIAEADVVAKINLQKKVAVQLSDQENSIAGKITLIESLENSLSRIVVDVDFASLESTSQDYCDLGLSAQISIDK